ncbi:MAG: hypothetical protein COV41_00480 [Candidatus Brennerbacteria bacterium CG11_big_fil_rev_8_21_14_0_20_43_10]|uniref:Small-conductance mechanosensitive ion channel n=2 Tax=Candidatus Brenneribacteriota TaxID=1817902 RepID=A0A2H9N5A8_9BACT|nr:MAG: hypothetical protein AUJ43_00530 [Parcubacteria group bacterium CG1_02_44_31]PIP50166.1 MAG: hypothetical protein COX12_02835 [Candidatus Brennerbacteria bacterium CG23_combo_of_CG06-09_8_20_14_all_44_41]PIR26884.1 MAG: hypothetical protein COV41_00480 [Candidatus Brennerbacteria bacterium CG11_big_fil_rev_8_21_14_0_20_43_10]PIX29094.1 MAG: hypothetical protein COZ64_00985 [Candidatus Brennerbacteria bacterium CG_4_8_14_3_um_filter_43_14]PJA19723.1 MAG: hypothetical protein COX61_00370 
MLNGFSSQFIGLQDAVYGALLLMYQEVLVYFPVILIAAIIFIVGLFIAKGLGRLVEQLVSLTKIDAWLAKTGARAFFDRAGVRLDISKFLGELVRWIMVLAFLMASADILGLTAVTGAIRDLLAYLPNVLVASVILLLTVVFGNFLQKAVKGAISGVNFKSSSFISAMVKWAVYIFGFLIAVHQLQIATDVINILLIGLTGMLAIAGGLSFGLGGRDYAHDLLERFRSEVEEK